MKEGQSRLSEICTIICDQFYNFDISNKEQESEFWNSFRNFHKELISESGSYDNLKNLIEEINKNVAIIASLRGDFEDNNNRALKEAARANLQNIIQKYIKCIVIIEDMKEKAILVENKTTSGNNLQWANLFLIKYYQIIAAEGCLEDSFIFLQAQLTTMDKEKIRGCFTRQKTRLTEIANGINFLKNLNGGFPQDLKVKVSAIDERIGKLRQLYSQNMDLNDQADKAIEVHENLKEDILKLYKETIEETIKRS